MWSSQENHQILLNFNQQPMTSFFLQTQKNAPTSKAHAYVHSYIFSILTVKTDLDPEFSQLQYEVLKRLTVSSRQFGGQHNAHVGPWCLCQGVREHEDPRVSQQHWSVCCQRVQPVTHLESTQTQKKIILDMCLHVNPSTASGQESGEW